MLKMNSPHFFCWVYFASAFGLVSGQGECLPMRSKPNILYIFTDDQSQRSVSCYEEARPWAKTPQIDKLADTGMRFTHCYTGAWCQPSRASALSGLLQHAVQTVKISKYPMATYDPGAVAFLPLGTREKTATRPLASASGIWAKTSGTAATGTTR